MRVALTVATLALCGSAASAQSQQPAPPAPRAPALKGFVRNWTRVETWRFFEPPQGGGDPTYADLANRFQIGIQGTTRRYDVTAAVQYVQFGGLPSSASGPGPLGVGALYFDHAGRSDSRQLYLRYLNLRIKDLAPGLTVQAGRMGFTSGAETASGHAKIEAVKRQRMDARLIGEFEWSIYQRSFDGLRADYRRPAWAATFAALRPTQGGFEDAAGVTIDDIALFAGALTFLPNRVLRQTEWQMFALRYDDHRAVGARPDNSGRSASVVDVQINSFGTHAVGAYPTAKGEMDVVLWLVGQTGGWYEQSHQAYAVAAEAGYQWIRAAWRPWIRAGWGRASGDAGPGDPRHGTFFQTLPTSRKYSLSTIYNLMNVNDAFAQALLRPRPALSVRADLHRVALATPLDRWYSGSGATQESGTVFGFAGRPSRGATRLGTILEAAVDYSIDRRWSVNGYFGLVNGGEVVRGSFAGDRLVFAYVENVLQF